jgi:3-phosphoshikimate 1-carboxyvinyltransferase
LLFGALASGTSRIRAAHAPRGLDACRRALGMLGISVESADQELVVRGSGLNGLTAPETPLDTPGAPVFWLGLLGCLSAQRFSSHLVQQDPEEVRGVLDALGSRGARLGSDAHAIHISVGSNALEGGAFGLSPAQAALKHPLLVSGLYATGATTVCETVVSSDHTERLLEALGCPISTLGPVVRLEPARNPRAIPGFEVSIPGSPSAAAYLQAVAAAAPSSHLVVRDVGLNPTRSSFLELLRGYGAEVGLSPHREALGEPAGEISVKANERRALRVGGELALRLDHELYALVFLAARATGTSEFSELPAWLTPNDVARIVAYLRSFGVEAEATEEGFVVEGKGERPLGATRVTTGGDPRLAVLGLLLGLCGEASSRIDDVESLSVLFPKLVGTLRALGARLELSE